MFVSLLLFSLFMCSVTAHPWGAPCSAGTLPGHGFQSQIAPPYKLELSKSCYLPGETIEVKLHGDYVFHGFVMQSRSTAAGKRHGLGQFLPNSSPNDLWKYNCGNGKYSITHSTPAPKAEIKVEWLALQDVGEVEIVATIFYSPQGNQFGAYWHEGAKGYLKPCELPETTIPPTVAPKLSQKVADGSATLGNQEQPKLDPKCNQEPPAIPWCDSDKPDYKIRWYHYNTTCTNVKWWDSNCDVDNGFETQDQCRKACNSVF